MLTYTMPPFKQAQQRLFANGDQVYDVQYNAAGRMGIGLEVGRFYIMDHLPRIHSIEFNMGVKTLRGVERFEAILDDPNRVTPFILRGDGDFGYNYATASFRANHVHHIRDNSFIIGSLGMNADYMFSGSQRFNSRNLPITTAMGERLLVQAHAKLGYGFKFTKGTIVVPSVETPILNMITWDDAKSTLHVFNSRYRPLIFRMTFIVLDKKSNRKCPTKGRSSGRSESLFGMLDGKAPW